MNQKLDAFLEGEPEPALESGPGLENQRDTAPEKEAAVQEPEPEPDPEPEGEPEPEAPEQPDGRNVPLRALEAERKQRQDWKDRAARAEAERDEVRRQLEEARKAPPPAPPPDLTAQYPDPQTDPVGYVQQILIMERLNNSEAWLRQSVGDEEVDRVQAEFKAAADKNPVMMQQLYSQPNPYKWAKQQVDLMRLQKDVGADPAAYRAKIEAELRAQIAAEYAGQQTGAPPVSPAAGRAPSIANARSAAPRSAPTFTGPPSIGEILGRG